MPSYYENVEASHNSMQVKHLYDSYFLLAKVSVLSEVMGYVFGSLLKHHLRRDNTFAFMKSCGNDVYKAKKIERRYIRTLKFMQSQFFDDFRRFFMDKK